MEHRHILYTLASKYALSYVRFHPQGNRLPSRKHLQTCQLSFLKVTTIICMAISNFSGGGNLAS